MGGGWRIPVQLLDRMEEITGKKAGIGQYPMRKFDPQMIVLDATLIRNELGWAPKVSLPDGWNRI